MFTDRFEFADGEGRRNTVTVHVTGVGGTFVGISDGLTVEPGFYPDKRSLYVERFLALPINVGGSGLLTDSNERQGGRQ